MNYNFYLTAPNYSSYFKKLCELKRDFPFLNISSLGRSVLSREIYSITIGNEKNATLFAGAFHAQEWLTCTLLVRYIEHIAMAQKQKTTICGHFLTESLKQRGLIIVPMVNPDGVSIALEGAASAGQLRERVLSIMRQSDKSWQANGRGVDLNHNYNAGFEELKRIERGIGIVSPSPRQYGGEFPHSEPETMAMVRLCNQTHIDTAYAFHSQGEEIFYEYGTHTPPKSYYIAELLAKSSGYSLVKNDGLYSHGGFKDYFIDNFRRPGFTFEIGKGVNPLPQENFEDIFKKLLETMLIATVI